MVSHFFKSLWVAIRSFSLGLLIGFLVAPHKGGRTREIVQKRMLNLFDTLLPNAISDTLGMHDKDQMPDKQAYWGSGAAPEDRPADLQNNQEWARGSLGSHSH